MAKLIATRLLTALIVFGSTTWAADGFILDGSSRCSVFRPNLKNGDGVRWKGRCMNGYAEGRGVATWTSAGGMDLTFEGTFVRGKLQGRGRMFSTEGDRYEGDYADGKRHGQGTYFSATGERYEGGYKDNLRHGPGVLTAVNGLSTRSEWRVGMPIVGNGAIASGAAQSPPLPRPVAPTPQSTDTGTTILDLVLIVGALFAAVLVYGWLRRAGSTRAKPAVSSTQAAASRDYVEPSERYGVDFGPQDKHVQSLDVDDDTVSVGDREDAWMEIRQRLALVPAKSLRRFGFFPHRPRSRVFLWRYKHQDRSFSIVLGISDEEVDRSNQQAEANVVIDVNDEVVDIVLHST